MGNPLYDHYLNNCCTHLAQNLLYECVIEMYRLIEFEFDLGPMIFDRVFCINLYEFSFIFLRELIISTTITHIKLKFDICMNVS